jgi:hypothetical protein
LPDNQIVIFAIPSDTRDHIQMSMLATPMSKEEELIKKVLSTYVTRNGFTEVKANIDGFEAPSALNNKGNEDRIIPDITGTRRGGRWYIEVVRKDADAEKTVSKWKLLSVLGRAKGGGLILISPPGSYAFAERLSKKHDIPVTIVKF